MRLAVNRRSNLARTRFRSNSGRCLIACIASASSSTMKPVTPFSTTSGTDPRRNAITGVPHAMASIITSPNGSGQSIGKQQGRGICEEILLGPFVDLPDDLDLLAVDQRLDLLLEIAPFGAR